MRLMLLAALVILTACVHVSDVVPMGEGRYLVSVVTRAGAAGGEVKAAEAANRYCDARGLHMVAIATQREGFAIGTAPVTDKLTFRCAEQ